jgi:glycosyltransferase involved in cell wall biosynthesis
MTDATRIVVGIPVYNGGAHLAETLDSFLGQTRRDFRILIHDNHSTDATCEIAETYRAGDDRIRVRRAQATVGMVENWRRTFWACREEFGGFEYFAFGSDHDYWHPRWLENMAAVLDRDAGVVVAFPMMAKMRQDGTPIDDWEPRRWDTAQVHDAADRVAAVMVGVAKPKPLNVIHGLIRAEALEQCGVIPSVLRADRALMNKLAAVGRFEQVPEQLWTRRYWDTPRTHQRTRLFTRGVPVHTYLPGRLVHTFDFLRWALSGSAVSRLEGARLAASTLRRPPKFFRRMTRHVRRTRAAALRPVRAALRRLRSRARGRTSR